MQRSINNFLVGNKGWCMAEQGELLHFTVDNILDRLDTPILEPLRNKIDIHVEQAFFCLYQHPSKKNKVLLILIQIIPLTLDRSLTLVGVAASGRPQRQPVAIDMESR